jgi:hypothetical protein
MQALNQELEEIGDADRIVEESPRFETPVSMLKANDPNRASAQTADTAWLRDTVRPLALGTKRKLNEQYLPRLRRRRGRVPRVRPGQLRGRDDDPPQRLGGLSGGMLTVDEAREEIGYAPVGGGARCGSSPRARPAPRRRCWATWRRGRWASGRTRTAFPPPGLHGVPQRRDDQ